MQFGNSLFEAYESGKHRRYTLLFAGNGGAFAVVELLTTSKRATGTEALTVEEIACGMLLFTLIMCLDILAFGRKMRKAWRDSLRDKSSISMLDGLFALPGWLVLGALWLLISLGWMLSLRGVFTGRVQPMNEQLGLILTLVSAGIALASAAFTWGQARAASKALRQGRLNRMFGSLDFSSQLAFSNPEIVYAVHGLDKEIPPEEVRNLIYFSVILDVYQAYWSDELNGDFAKGERDFRERSRYLNQILRVPENLRRWEIIKPLCYGDFDRDFVRAIDGLFLHERGKLGIPMTEREGNA